MKMRMNINTKMLVYILTTSVLIFASSVGYISYKTRKLALQNSERLALKVAQENAIRIEKLLSEDLAVLQTLAQAFTVYDGMDEQTWKDLFLKMYYKVYENKPSFYKLWDSWELKAFDPNWTKDHGRYAITLYKDNGVVVHSESIRSVDGDSELYANIKNISENMIWEPYWDAYLEQSEEKKFMTSLSSPIYRDNKFAGIVAADIIMDRFQKIIDDIKPYESTCAFLTSNQGVFVGHQQKGFIGESISKVYPEFEDQFKISDIIKEGKPRVFRAVNKENNKVIVAIAPIQVGDYKSPWALTLEIPQRVILAESNATQLFTLLVAFVGLVLLSIIIVFIANHISTALQQTTSILHKLAQGDIEGVGDINLDRNDEIGLMANSVNALKDGLIATSVFAAQIGKGNLGVTFDPLSEKDVLGNSLLEMRNSLVHAEQAEQKRKIEDDKTNWSTHGLAKFGEILRDNSNKISVLSYNIMSNLVNYLDVNQGALFIIDNSDENDVVLELKSAVAYGREKFMHKRLSIGESLVGRCAFERKTIYMTDIPQNYINITSGMGTANPSALLLVPLLLNDAIFGVIELASFNTIEQYQIDFVEKVGESIASTISSVKVNEKTTLLLEQSKLQAEELAAQEEEMRQNMEELQATQEEAGRREYELMGVIKALGTTAFTVEYDLDGIILTCNQKYAEMLGMSIDQIIGQNHKVGFDFTPEMKANYDLFWGDLKRGISKREISKIKINNKEFWVEETYSPIVNQSDERPYKILKIGFDITNQKIKEQLIQEQEINIKKERLLLSEYQSRISTITEQLKAANIKIEKLEQGKAAEPKETIKVEEPEMPEFEIRATENNLLDWDDLFLLDIDELDEQHKQIVNLVNTFYKALVITKNKKEIKESLNSCIDFISYHFGNEEAYFESFGFNDVKAHKADHQKFLKTIKQYQTELLGKSKITIDITPYIQKWLYNHFTNLDSKYKVLFKENGL